MMDFIFFVLSSIACLWVGRLFSILLKINYSQRNIKNGPLKIISNKIYSWGLLLMISLIIILPLINEYIMVIICIPLVFLIGHVTLLARANYYHELKKELFYDNEGHFLLKGKEIRFPM